MIHGGYILKARKMLESDLMNKPPLWSKLWDWMLLRAEWRTCAKLERGQFITSVDEMREAMSWLVGYRRVTPTKDEIRSAYEGFAKAAMVTTTKTTRGMIVTITNYDTYQRPENYEARDETRNEKDTKPAVAPHDSKEVLSKKKENEESENLNTSCAHLSEAERTAPDEIALEPAVFLLPLNTGDQYPVTESALCQLEPLYPAVNVREEFRKMLGWFIGNPTKRKTKKGIMRFVTSWLSKAQDRGGGMAQGQLRVNSVYQQKQVEGSQKARLINEIRRAEDEQRRDAQVAAAGRLALSGEDGRGRDSGNGRPVDGCVIELQSARD